MMERDTIYFASDFHLDNSEKGKERELRVVAWLDSIKHNAKEIYLLGDVFDFWFEYKYVIPKGFSRLFGKLAELSDAGVDLHIFTGNHDVWMFDYFTEEFNAVVHREEIRITRFDKTLIVGHGDGLGPGDHGYKFIKAIFTNRLCQRLFAALHPGLGVSLARFFSRKSRESTRDKDAIYLGDDKEYLVRYCNSVNEKESIDYFIFGHRHMLLDKELANGGRYLNLGAWFENGNFARLDRDGLELEKA